MQCYLDNEYTLSAVWPWSNALAWLRLKVPASLVDQVREILSETISEEDLVAQTGAEAQPELTDDGKTSFGRGVNRNRKHTPMMLVIFFFCCPSADLLRIFYI